MGRTLSRVQQALSWSYGEEVKPFKPPLSDAEFHSYLNSQGQLTRPEELRLRIYHGGVEPSLRKVIRLTWHFFKAVKNCLCFFVFLLFSEVHMSSTSFIDGGFCDLD